MKKMLFIYNPNSGMGLLKPKLSDVLDIFVKGGYEVTVYPTQKYHDAVRKMGEYEEQYDLVACSGGDGTLDEVVTGMMKREKKVPIGYIPAGTTNDFASSLHISKNMLEAADTVVNGVPFACDVGVFNQDYFVYIAAFGLFTDVSYETKQSMKNVLGHLAYILEGTLFKTPRNPMELNEILGALALRKINPKRMYSFKTNEVHFETEEEIPWTLDGEFGGVHEEVVVKDCQKALEIMVKPEVIEDVSEKKGTE